MRALSAQKTTKQTVVNSSTIENSNSKVHALHCADELLVHIRLSFKKTLAKEVRRQLPKTIFVMINHIVVKLTN